MGEDRIVLLDVGDGPEGITIYTSENEGTIDWSQTFPALYVDISINGAYAHFGPFSLKSIYESVKKQIGG